MSSGFKDLLALEIKKEIADRYFGFRKLIEEDKLDLATRIKHHSFVLQKRISFELLRIYILLAREDLIHAFLEMTGLDSNIFYDPQFAALKNFQERLFTGIPLHGFSRKGRFFNLLLDSYDRFAIHAEQYCRKVSELQDMRQTIDEEIRHFFQQNDLGTILGFLKSLADPAATSGMEGGMEVGLAKDLEEKIRLTSPPPIEHYLPLIGPLPPVTTMKKQIKTLASRAFAFHGQEFMNAYSEKMARPTG